MSVFVDRKFLKLLSPKLKKFVQKKDDLYNFRCPFCGDSQKNENKARGYVFRKSDNYFYKCQNCGVSHNMYNFINFVDEGLTKEYMLESLKVRVVELTTRKEDFAPPVFAKKVEINLPKISDLDEKHYAVQYCMSRKIPEDKYSSLYYAEDFKKFVVEVKPDNGKDLKEDDPRLIIPFFGKDGALQAFQGRALRDSKIRYITIKLDDSFEKIFGLNTVNQNEKIYVVEGPIDSLFIENAVATADSNLSFASKVFNKSNLVLVFDNEPRNKEICKLMDDAIENHYQICIWPEMIKEKDINDMIVSGFSSDEIKDIIDMNTYVNLRAKLEFLNWRKI